MIKIYKQNTNFYMWNFLITYIINVSENMLKLNLNLDQIRQFFLHVA